MYQVILAANQPRVAWLYQKSPLALNPITPGGSLRLAGKDTKKILPIGGALLPTFPSGGHTIARHGEIRAISEAQSAAHQTSVWRKTSGSRRPTDNAGARCRYTMQILGSLSKGLHRTRNDGEAYRPSEEPAPLPKSDMKGRYSHHALYQPKVRKVTGE